MLIHRREFLKAAGLAGLAMGRANAADESTPNWGGPVIDCHFHLRRDLEANVAHLNGCGVTQALLLANAKSTDEVKMLRDQSGKRFPAWAVSTDITKPEAAQILTDAVKAGAGGLGELKSHVEATGPELRKMYALAAELQVPILIHFQEVPHTPQEGVFSTGFQEQFEAMLKAFPHTQFIGHADAFWANVSADYKNQVAYPAGPIVRGGVTDRLLSDYPNLFGDLSANSGNNALSRDPEFTRDFLSRHQNKLIFGSDCGCADGKGGGVSQANNPVASRLSGKCVARETLALVKRSSSPEVFEKLRWKNGHRVYRIAV